MPRWPPRRPCATRWFSWPVRARSSWSGPVPPAEGEEIEALRRIERDDPGAAVQPAGLAASAPDLVGAGSGRAPAACWRARWSCGGGRRWRASTPVSPSSSAGRRAPRSVISKPAWQIDRRRCRRAAAAGLGGSADRPSSPRLCAVRSGPLVTTYGVTPYADVDPTPFAAASFVLMFGMMFGDVGHGLVLAALGLRAPAPGGADRLSRSSACSGRCSWAAGARVSCRVRPALRRGFRADRSCRRALACIRPTTSARC